MPVGQSSHFILSQESMLLSRLQAFEARQWPAHRFTALGTQLPPSERRIWVRCPPWYKLPRAALHYASAATLCDVILWTAGRRTPCEDSYYWL